MIFTLISKINDKSCKSFPLKSTQISVKKIENVVGKNVIGYFTFAEKTGTV